MDCPNCGIANTGTAVRCAACYTAFQTVQHKVAETRSIGEADGTSADTSKVNGGLNRTVVAACGAGGAVIGTQAVAYLGSQLLFPALGMVIAAYTTAKKCD